MPLERDLHDLLYTHDCVIVPRFGGFLTHYRSARLDEQRQNIQPPAKDLSFNRHLVRTDGLLADQVARRETLNHTQANAMIDGEVDAWHSKLARDGRLELPRIGTFYRDAESNLQFDPDRRVNFLKDSFGLRPLPAVALAPATPVRTTRVIPLPTAEPHGPAPKVERGMPFAWAAAMGALLLTAGTWYVVATSDPKDVNWGGFDPFKPAHTAVYAPHPASHVSVPLVVDTVAVVLDADLHGLQPVQILEVDLPTTLVDMGPEPTPAAPEPSVERTIPTIAAPAVTTAVSTQAVRKRYHVIGGCFLLKENAETFVADLQARGFAATIVDQKGGLYRVAYGSYPDRSLALEALAAVRKEEAPNAWLLSR
jgi:cell division septation protein DedD/nucleoid DNA-binding protein